ncbi:MAG: ABC transporter permease [bacterium]|nr:ABC transporter permease [Gammaproteobacteria bacterium]
MNTINQIIAITLMNLRNIPSRFGASLVIIVGIAGVVTVLVALLAMAKGFEATLKGTGQPDRAIVMRSGSTSEMTSGVSASHGRIIETKPGLADSNNGALAAGELYVIADIRKRANNSEANMPMRGVQPNSFLIRDEVKIVAGRNFEFGRFEMIAGVKAADQFHGIDVGSTVSIRGADWKLVGLFESNGSIHESEVWVDHAVLVSNLKRGNGYSSMVVRLLSPLDLDVFRQSLGDDPQLEVSVVRETKYYSEQSTGITSLITQFGYGVSIIMAIGAVFGALNTMYSAVSTRSVEIATLRALGFGPTPVVISVMVEALALSIIGGLIGGLIAWTLFNGYTASTMSNSTFSQVSFSFSVTGELLLRGIVWSCMLGLIGGLFPSVAAARQPVTAALRGL